MIEVSDMTWQTNREQEQEQEAERTPAQASQPPRMKPAVLDPRQEGRKEGSLSLFSAISSPQTSSSLFFLLFLSPSKNCMKTKINGCGRGHGGTEPGGEHGRTFILVPENLN